MTSPYHVTSQTMRSAIKATLSRLLSPFPKSWTPQPYIDPTMTPRPHPHYAHTGLPLTDDSFRARADARSAELKQQRISAAPRSVKSYSVFDWPRQPISSLCLCQDNDILTFTPQPDITTLELAHIQVLIAHASASHSYPDFKEYIARNGLGRHFTKKD